MSVPLGRNVTMWHQPHHRSYQNDVVNNEELPWKSLEAYHLESSLANILARPINKRKKTFEFTISVLVPSLEMLALTVISDCVIISFP